MTDKLIENKRDRQKALQHAVAMVGDAIELINGCESTRATAIAKIELQTGLMWLNRAISRNE